MRGATLLWVVLFAVTEIEFKNLQAGKALIGLHYGQLMALSEGADFRMKILTRRKATVQKG